MADIVVARIVEEERFRIIREALANGATQASVAFKLGLRKNTVGKYAKKNLGCCKFQNSLKIRH